MDSHASSSALEIAKNARAAFLESQVLDAEEKNKALAAVKQALVDAKDEILAANKSDVDDAKLQAGTGISASLIKRLDLCSSADKYDSMIQGIEDVASLPDPTGQVTYASHLDEGLDLYRLTCPFGVILVIFEARPEVIVNITALAIKSGNAAILKGGKESLKTQAVLSKIIQHSLSKTCFPRRYIQTVETRQEIAQLLEQDQYIDLVIPRGGNELVRNVQKLSKMPVMGHADGLCTIYLDETANVEKAVRVTIDSKITYPAACNAVETLLVHESLKDTVFPVVIKALLDVNVTIKLAQSAHSSCLSNQTISSHPNASNLIQLASSPDFGTEFLDLTIACQFVHSIDEAIKHINQYSSHHTDSIITESQQSASQFTKTIDSAGVYVNASTRFADGFRYGFGTEVGVSTGKSLARGPVGLDGLVTYKYVARSLGENGHVTAEFGVGDGKRPFLHQAFQPTHGPY